MKKTKIIKKSEEFSQIISNGESKKNKYFSLYYQTNVETLYGITVPKKIGKAHIRNKLKRQIKNIIIQNEKDIQKNFNYVIIIKEAALALNYKEMQEEILALFKKVGI